MRHFLGRCCALLAVVLLAIHPVAAMGAEKKPLLKSGQYNADHATVELFAGMESGEIEVKFIPQDSKVAQVLIENKTRQPLNVKLPAAFAGVPVLGQFFGPQQQRGGNPFGGGGQGQQGGGGQNQSTGGGLGQQANGNGNGGNQQQGNFFNVPAERVGKLKVALVCLEHGKPEPRAAIPYKIVPIESFSDNPEVAALCTLLGQGQMSQKSAQFAAWHLTDEISLTELTNKKIEHLDGSSELFFTAEEVRGGKTALAEAAKIARQTPAIPASAAKGAATAAK